MSEDVGQTGNVPALRFPEFDGEWGEARFGEIVDFSSGGTPSKGVDAYWGGNIPWISAASMHDDNITTSERTVTELGSKNGTRVAAKGTVLMLVRGSMLYNRVPAGICQNEVTFNQDVKALTPKANETPEFLLTYIRAIESKLLAKVTGTGIGAGKLDTDELKAMYFYRPKRKEQQKIASFLTAVDEKIVQLQEKKTLLEEYKKGCMQQLFSQTIRFKDDNGNDYPDWEEKRLGDVAEIVGGGTPDTNNEAFWNGDVNWFTPTEIKTKYIEGSKRKITALGLQHSSAKLLPKGTLLLSTRATVGDIGIANNESATNQGFQSLLIRDQHNNEFWYYWIKKNRKKLLRVASGSTFLEVSKLEICKIPCLSPHLNEQQKIADFLSAIDDKITHVATQLDHAKTFKKGLLQKMFV